MSTTTAGTPTINASPAAADTPIISASGVVKTYNTGKVTVPALRGVDLTVNRGEMVAIMGPSGCGKTTLLNCLSGLDTIDEGEILIAGKDLAHLPDNARTDFRARNMGFVFQFYNLLPVLSAVENVELPLLVSGVKPKESRERALKILDRVGLRDWASHRPAELSGGQRQRVTVARALVNEPAIVWADEPTGDLDSETADDVMNLMIELNKTQQQTFVIVTHDPRIGDMTQRIIRMSDGRIVNDGLSGDR
ncbi:MAG TPA: ABC transporter ATP-binding protein [Thermomicrobiales bacterium]|jgi:putative ABC transport system ATP-binding protein|nr:ABC transporter ATP-binding protein [Thermomicrobiales bacterium]